MSAGIVVVQQYQRLVVQKLGIYQGTQGPGLKLLIPILYHATKVDLRERVTRVPTQKYITADNVVVDMDFVIYYRVMEEHAERAVLEVQNFELAVVNLAFATLRAVIGATTLSSALAERERIRDEVQIRMDENTERWGVKISQVEMASKRPWNEKNQLRLSRLQRSQNPKELGSLRLTSQRGRNRQRFYLPKVIDRLRFSRQKGNSKPPCFGPRGSVRHWNVSIPWRRVQMAVR